MRRPQFRPVQRDPLPRIFIRAVVQMVAGGKDALAGRGDVQEMRRDEEPALEAEFIKDRQDHIGIVAKPFEQMRSICF